MTKTISERGNPQSLNELDMDALKTTGKALGNRVKDAGLATFGNQKAHGRLSTRIMADRMMKAWLRYQGAVDKPATKEVVYSFLRRQFGNLLPDAELRQLTQMPAAPVQQPTGQQPNATANQTAQADQSAQPTGQPTGQPSPAAGPAQPVQPAKPFTINDWVKLPTPEPKNAVMAKALELVGNDNSKVTDAVMNKAYTEYKAENPQAFATSAPESPAAQSAAPSSPTATATPSAPPVTGTEPVESPSVEQPAETPPTAAPKAPTPPTAPVSPATRPILRQRSAPSADAAPKPTHGVIPPSTLNTGVQAPLRARSGTPAQTDATSTPVPPTTPAAPVAPSAPVAPQTAASSLNQLGTMLRQPKVNSTQVMQTLGKAVQNTQPGTPDRQKLVQVIQAMRANPAMLAKVPQLRQLNLEGYRPNGSRLVEADLQEPELSRSALDKLFINVSREIMDQNLDGAQRNTAKSPQNQQTKSSETPEDQIKPYLRQRVSPEKFDTILRDPSVRLGSDDTKVAAKIGERLKAMKQSGNVITISDLLRELEITDHLPLVKLSFDIIAIIIRAKP